MKTNSIFTAFFIAVLILNFGSIFLPDDVKAIESPTIVTGEITELQNCHQSSSGSSSYTCTAVYTYNYNGMSYRATSGNDSNMFDRGDSVKLIIDKNTPTYCAPFGDLMISICLILVAFGIPVGSFIYIFKNSRPTDRKAVSA